MTLRQHAQGVFGWSRFQPERGYDFNGTALVCDDTVLLVDPVRASESETSALRRLGREHRIVLLNADHEREAATFHRELHAPVFIARADREALKLSSAQPLDDGAALPGGWTFLTLTGLKTPGESALFHPTRRLCVVGDAIIADPLTGLRLVPPAKLGDRRAALAGLARLTTLDFDGLLVGDGFHLPSGGRAALTRFVARELSLLDGKEHA